MQTFGISIGGTVIQNVLLKQLPPQFLDTLPQGAEIAYAVIPTIPALLEPIKDEVRHAFALALQTVWRVMIGVSGVGLLSCLFMREVELRTDMDEQWALKEPERDSVGVIEEGSCEKMVEKK